MGLKTLHFEDDIEDNQTLLVSETLHVVANRSHSRLTIFRSLSVSLCLLHLQLENYAKTEEAKVEELIKGVADSGANQWRSSGRDGATFS